ncbi:MAG: alpha-L-rhamnosidase [Clostridia bacterium]|nr:alpha-L-rhamnosidase [Clostridia bacterium]
MKVNDILTDINIKRDERIREFITPCRVVAKSTNVFDVKNLLEERAPQVTLNDMGLCVIRGVGSFVLLDFGVEFSGGVRICVSGVRSESGRADILVRFGESATEAMTPLGEKNATNDHANREFKMNVGALSMNETNESGLRFVYIEMLTAGDLALKAVQGVFVHRDLEWRGSFECSDARLTKIWNTAAYTVFLNMQDCLWDGIKRDRLVWIGDINPEIKTILAVFGENDIIPKSLDLIRDTTPEGRWMNNISSYSMWWVINQYEWYVASGDKQYLLAQGDTLYDLMCRFIESVGDDGREQLMRTGRFLDWQSSDNPKAIHAGLQALLKLAIEYGGRMCELIGYRELAARCEECVSRMARYVPYHGESKQAASLLALAGLRAAEDINTNVLTPGGVHGYSTFFGYYILKTKGDAGDIDGALDDIRRYWGGMLDMGATTFWEDFNVDWMKNAFRIDELPRGTMRDIHGDFGDYCYKNFRHSLCHGWASGPCPFISEYVLGVRRLSHDTFTVDPLLGDLDWVHGKYPTAFGEIEIEAEKRGYRTAVKVKAPRGVKIKK